MPKSADETAGRDDHLGEESDVIELTEEVSAADRASSESQGQDAEDELDALTREMPEFRVPDSSDSDPADEPTEATEAGDEPSDEEIVELKETVDPEDAEIAEVVPSAAIFSGRRKPAESASAPHESDEDLRATIVTDAEPTPDDLLSDGGATSDVAAQGDQHDPADGDQQGAEAPEAVAEQGGEEVGYDRQAMVKTIQMDAIDRSAFERQVQAEDYEDSQLLLDHSYAPDVLVFPPRVLTTRWKEGGPLLRAGEVQLPDESADIADDAGQADDAVELPDEQQDESAAADTLDDADLPELEPDAVELELDSEVIEDAEVKPPPKPAPKADAPQGPPPKRAEEAAKPKQGQQQKSQGQTPKKQSQNKKSKKGAGDSDPELSGLVQELLDEGKEAREKKKQSQKPRSPRETWFQKVFTDEYLRTLPKDIHRQTKREADFIEETFELGEDDRVLDLACGFGRHSIELTRRGFEVAGLDLSMPLLQKALNEAQKQSLSIKFIHGDMRDLSFEAIFSACFLWQTSFGYFDDQTNFRVLRGIHRSLRPGGSLLIDVLNRDHIVTEMPHRLWWEGVNCVFLEEVELDHRTSVLHTKRSFIYEDGTPPLEQNTFIRVYSLHELRQLLQAAGFAVREISGELHHRGRFLGPASSRIIIHAKKRPPKGGRK